MSSPTPLSALLLTFLLGTFAPAAAQAPSFDLTGEWTFTVDSPNGSGTRDVEFVQDGDELTGVISSSMASGELRGTIEEDTVRFVAVVAMDSGSFEITYVARYEDGRLVDGRIDFGDYGGGTFTGWRKEPGGTLR